MTPSDLPKRRLHRCSRTLLSDESVSRRLLLLPLLAPSRPRNSPRTFFKCTDSSPLFSSRSMVQAIHSLGTENPEMVHAELWCACLEVNSGHSSLEPCIISACTSHLGRARRIPHDEIISGPICHHYITHIRLKIPASAHYKRRSASLREHSQLIRTAVSRFCGECCQLNRVPKTLVAGHLTMPRLLRQFLLYRRHKCK